MTSSDARVRGERRTANPAPGAPFAAERGPKASPRDLYSRFIPREELSSFASWSFGEVSGSAASPARAEPEAPVDPAERHAEELRAARQSGYQDGYRDGLVALEGFKQSFASQTTTQVGALVKSIGEQLDALQQEMARGVADAAAALARQVLRSELATRPEAVAAVAEQAIDALLLSARHIVLRVHPDDHALIAGHSAEAIAARGARVVSDPQIQRGGCRVDSDIGLVDATIDERWRRAVAALGSGLPWQAASDPGEAPAPTLGPGDDGAPEPT
ncbi:MAG TPA: FliH/SctL family protein [Caldimonas sp.]|jgi:flagellar assembly protein FliH|nr:FliH/SctL family protein [Caldimonas sp.]HEX4234534.1 FliH/SctL family protein [Caldimonas sp.]